MSQLQSQGKERLEFFSDGVFAIVATLLVIELPHLTHLTQDMSIFVGILDNWPFFVSYVVSFIAIGDLWSKNHNMFHLFEKSDHNFRMLNILYLMFVAFIPFAASTLAEFIESPAHQTQSVLLYAGNILIITILSQLVWLYAIKNGLTKTDLSIDFLNKITKRYYIGIGLSSLAFVSAFVDFRISLFILISLMIIPVLFSHVFFKD